MIRKSYPHHIGLTGAESEMIHDQRIHQDNLEFLMNFDLEELSSQEVQQIRDIAEREYTCKACEKNEERAYDIVWMFDNFIDELNSRLQDLRDYIPRNDKELCKEYNRFLKCILEDFNGRKSELLKKYKLEMEYDLIRGTDPVEYQPDE